MKKYFFLSTLTLFCFLGTDCKDDPIPPCTDCPQPLDTTSHNWMFEQPHFLGDGASSVLYDVAIINDTLAYAVGEIRFKDSTGNWDPNIYNAVKWDGQNWTLLRIPFIGPCSAVTYPPLRTIWAFTPDNILVSNGGSVVTYDGMNTTMDCRMNSLLTGAITKIFATSPNDIYLIGGSGTIVHYSGSSWTKITSGTNLSFRDIYGATDSKTGEQQILALCSENVPHERGLYRLQGNTATQLSTYPLNYDLAGLWFVPNKHYYLVGSGIFEKNSLAENTWKPDTLSKTKYTTSRVRGNGVNDVFIVGAFGEFLHWNGRSWRSFINETGVTYGGYGGLAVKGNLVIGVGVDSPLAVAIVGRRQQ